MIRAIETCIKHRLPILHWIIGFYELQLENKDKPIQFLPSGFSYIFITYGDPILLKSGMHIQGVVLIPPQNDILRVLSLGKTKLIVVQCTTLTARSITQVNETRTINEFVKLTHLLNLSFNTLEPQYFVRKYLKELCCSEPPALLNTILRFINDTKGLVSVTKIAARYSCSTRYLHLQFKKHLKTSPREFLLKVKLYYCVNELRSNTNQQEVLEQYEYYKLSRFKQCFNNIVGIQYAEFLHQD